MPSRRGLLGHAALAAMLALVLAPGCGHTPDETTSHANGDAGAGGAAETASGDCAEPSHGPARGRIAGLDFTVESGKIENGILELRQGTDFFADRALTLFLFLDEGEVPTGRGFEHDGEGFGGPHVHMSWRTDGESMPETEMFMSDYSLSVSFDQETDGKLPGRIHLCLPDERNSFISGTFTATIEGFRLVDGRPDYRQDAFRNFDYLAADHLREAAGARDVEIVGTERSRYSTPEDATSNPTGSAEVTYRIDGGDPQARRFAFVKESGLWRVDQVLGMDQLVEAHPFDTAKAATDRRTAIAYVVARELEEMLRDRYPGRAIYPSNDMTVIQSYSYSTDSAEVTAGIRIEGVDAPIEQQFRLEKGPAGWAVVGDV